MARNTNDTTRTTTPTSTISTAGAPGGAPSRGRAAAVLTGVVVLGAVLLVGLGFAVTGLVGDAPPPTGGNQSASAPGYAGQNSAGDGLLSRDEQQLITRPMLAVPDQAALPHALSGASAGPPLALPAPAVVVGTLVPQGFPATAEGALAQLAALTRAGAAGADPAVYDRAYVALAEPGAPQPGSSYVHGQLADLRSSAGLRPAGPVPGLTITWTPTSGLVKGSAAGGSLVVVCVLGQLDVDYQGRVASAGLGDCQALRRVGSEWRIAAGPPAAPAPSAWPGSSEAVAAGYRELR